MLIYFTKVSYQTTRPSFFYFNPSLNFVKFHLIHMYPRLKSDKSDWNPIRFESPEETEIVGLKKSAGAKNGGEFTCAKGKKSYEFEEHRRLVLLTQTITAFEIKHKNPGTQLKSSTRIITHNRCLGNTSFYCNKTHLLFYLLAFSCPFFVPF